MPELGSDLTDVPPDEVPDPNLTLTERERRAGVHYLWREGKKGPFSGEWVRVVPQRKAVRKATAPATVKDQEAGLVQQRP